MTTQLQPVEGMANDIGLEGAMFVSDIKRIEELLITDRDTAYTMLRTMIEGKRRPMKESMYGTLAYTPKDFEYNAALDDILTLLDHIYGKTDALTK